MDRNWTYLHKIKTNFKLILLQPTSDCAIVIWHSNNVQAYNKATNFLGLTEYELNSLPGAS